MTTYITNIGLLATPRGDSARRGRQQGEITLLRDAWVAVEGGKIAAVGQGQPVPEDGDILLDAGGRLMTPGLVDAHTHLIFGGWRQNELGQKLRGVPYLDILAQGGGILSTVRATRAASEEQLAHKAEAVLAEMLRMGVTTCEAKSGYGLEPEQEYKQLRVIRRLNETPSSRANCSACRKKRGRRCRSWERPAGGIPGAAGGLYPPAVPGDDPLRGPGGPGGVL